MSKNHQHFDLDDFFNYIHFFFKLLTARREDYASLEVITNFDVEYAKKHRKKMVINEICSTSMFRSMHKF